MHYVQLTLTDSQVGLLAGAAKNAALDSENEQEREQLFALVDFLYAVEANPTAFPVRDPRMARSIKKRMARLKGPTQPKPNKRKRAQLRSQSGQKRNRAQRKALVAAFNEAVAVVEAAREIEQAQADRTRAEAAGIILPE